MPRLPHINSLISSRSFVAAEAFALLAVPACSSTRGRQAPPPEYPKRAALHPPACRPGDDALGHLRWSSLTDDVKTWHAAKEVSITLRQDESVEKLSLETADAAAVPASVVETAKRHLPGYTIDEVELEHYASLGKVFEVELKKGEQECEVAVRADGRLLYKECQVDAPTLPKAVAQSLRQALPQAKAEQVERRESAEQSLEWIIETKLGDVTHRLRFQADGKLLAHHLKLPAEVYVEVR